MIVLTDAEIELIIESLKGSSEELYDDESKEGINKIIVYLRSKLKSCAIRKV